MVKDIRTEEKVLDAAKKVFIENGYSGTSMQQIATEAGINKALLHYYFRNKENLFEAAFADIFKKFAPQLQNIFQSDTGFFEKLEQFIASYLDILMTQPLVPIFILQEINRNPELLYHTITRSGISPEFFIAKASEEMKEGNIIDMDPRHLFINILALCIFPFAARPLLQRVFFNKETRQYDQFLQERKKQVTEFVINAIRTK